MFTTDAGLLLADDIASKSVHKVLGAGLTSTELSQAVTFLLVEHLAILDLGFDIGANFFLAFFCSLCFVGLVLTEHLLEVLLFLSALLLLELTLHFHFFLKSVHKVNLSLKSFLVLLALPLLFFTELAITTLLLLLDFLVLGLDLLLLTLTKESNVLFLEGFVHATLIHLRVFAILLLLHLLVELLSNQSTALLLTEHCLLLLLVVKQSVEFLNGGPLVLLSELRVDFRLAVNLTRRNAYVVTSLLPDGSGLGATTRAGD